MTKPPRTPAAAARKRTSKTPARTAKKVSAKKTATKPAAGQPPLLSGGNPQVAKGYGDAPVRAYIAAMSGWKRDIGRRIDAMTTRAVPGVRKAVKWNSPLYGDDTLGEDNVWFMSFHCFTRYVKIAFFRGAALKPMPPGTSTQKNVRYLNIYEDDAIDEAKLMAWIKQASKLPG